MIGHKQNWFWVVFPANAAMAAFGTMLPLYIISLGGTVLQVGSFVGIFTAVGIPASMFWGVLSNNPSRRRIFFTTTYAGMTLAFVLMFEFPTLGWLGILYAFLGFVIVANSSTANVLLMETMEEKSWMSGVAGISILANLGAIFGLATSIAVVNYSALNFILIFATTMSVLSLSLAFLLIDDPRTPDEIDRPRGEETYSSGEAWVSHVQSGDVNISGIQLARRILRSFIRPFLTAYGSVMPLFFLSTFFFNLAIAYLNVSYVPFLFASGVPAGMIFFLPLMNTATQIATYINIRKFVAKYGRAALGESSIFVIILLYLIIATSGMLLHGIPFIVLNLMCYALVGLMFALWNSSTAVSLFTEMDPDQRGTIMGGYIGLSSLGVLVGSFLSGATSFYIGYVTTFVAAAFLMGIALVLRARFNASREVSHPVGSVRIPQ